MEMKKRKRIFVADKSKIVFIYNSFNWIVIDRKMEKLFFQNQDWETDTQFSRRIVINEFRNITNDVFDRFKKEPSSLRLMFMPSNFKFRVMGGEKCEFLYTK